MRDVCVQNRGGGGGRESARRLCSFFLFTHLLTCISKGNRLSTLARTIPPRAAGIHWSMGPTSHPTRSPSPAGKLFARKQKVAPKTTGFPRAAEGRGIFSFPRAWLGPGEGGRTPLPEIFSQIPTSQDKTSQAKARQAKHLTEREHNSLQRHGAATIIHREKPNFSKRSKSHEDNCNDNM